MKGENSKYWLEHDLHYIKRGRIFIPKGELQKYLMIEIRAEHFRSGRFWTKINNQTKILF